MSDCHWGLTQWFCGINEYVIDRCICSAENNFDPRDPDRMYGNDTEKMTTNCCCIFLCAGNTCLFNNPIGGLLCLPFALSSHLLVSLPLACCSMSKETGFKIHTLTEEEKRKEIVDKYGGAYAYARTPSYTLSSDADYQKIRDAQYRESMNISMANNVNWNNSPMNPYGQNKL